MCRNPYFPSLAVDDPAMFVSAASHCDLFLYGRFSVSLKIFSFLDHHSKHSLVLSSVIRVTHVVYFCLSCRSCCSHIDSDTTLCTAHATAADVLWQSVPVLTVPGNTFPKRVATSLLAAAGLEYLSVPSLSAYAAAAVSLYMHPEALAAARARLTASAALHLYNTDEHVRCLERAVEITVAVRRRWGRAHNIVLSRDACGSQRHRADLQ